MYRKKVNKKGLLCVASLAVFLCSSNNISATDDFHPDDIDVAVNLSPNTDVANDLHPHDINADDQRDTHAAANINAEKIQKSIYNGIKPVCCFSVGYLAQKAVSYIAPSRLGTGCSFVAGGLITRGVLEIWNVLEKKINYNNTPTIEEKFNERSVLRSVYDTIKYGCSLGAGYLVQNAISYVAPSSLGIGCSLVAGGLAVKKAFEYWDMFVAFSLF
jgi:hypothetical protein